MSDQRETLNRLGDMIPPPGDPFDRLLTRRDRRRRGRRVTAAVLALSLTAAGVFTAYEVGRRNAPSATVRPLAGPLPDVAQITCDGTASVTARTPQVRPQPDGVHVEIRNTSAAVVMFSLESSEGFNGGERAEPGLTAYSSTGLAPGTVTVKCFAEGQDPSAIEGTTFEVVDQDHVFTSTNVDCPGGMVQAQILDYIAGAPGEEGEPTDIARIHLGDKVQPGDVVEVAGYLGARDKIVRVVRDGRVVASAELVAAIEGGYLVTMISWCDNG